MSTSTLWNNMGLELTPYLWTPATWMAGKQAAILTYIDQWKKPVLVGGDTPSVAAKYCHTRHAHPAVHIIKEDSR